jgi:hypothetical protein
VRGGIREGENVDYILHSFSFEILLPHIVVVPAGFDIKTSRIFVVLDVTTTRWD